LGNVPGRREALVCTLSFGETDKSYTEWQEDAREAVFEAWDELQALERGMFGENSYFKLKEDQEQT
jgi:hypothetical protein